MEGLAKKRGAGPLKSIRFKCLDCCGGQFREVELCGATKCPLYPYRFGKHPNGVKRQSSLRVIRSKCFDCTASVPGEYIAVRACGIDDCPLHLFRLGKNPNRAGRCHAGNFGTAGGGA